MRTEITETLIAAVLEVFTPEGVVIWLREWLVADDNKRDRMWNGALVEWSGHGIHD